MAGILRGAKNRVLSGTRGGRVASGFQGARQFATRRKSLPRFGPAPPPIPPKRRSAAKAKYRPTCWRKLVAPRAQSVLRPDPDRSRHCGRASAALNLLQDLDAFQDNYSANALNALNGGIHFIDLQCRFPHSSRFSKILPIWGSRRFTLLQLHQSTSLHPPKFASCHPDPSLSIHFIPLCTSHLRR